MKKVAPFLSLALLSLLDSGAVFAAGGGHGEEQAAGPWSLVWPFINFFIFFGGLFFVLKNPFLQAWSKRRTTIEEAVTRGARELAAAEKELAAAKTSLSSVDVDARNLTASISKDTGSEVAQIVDEAKRRAEFIGKQAGENLTAEQRHAEVTLRREVAQRAIEKATGLLKSEITPEVDRDLRKGVVSGVRQLAQ